MAKLNQIIAIEKGIKERVMSGVTNIYQAAQKADLFNGFNKSYEKINAEGEDLPAERKKVALVAGDVLANVALLTSELLDVTARKDWTNMGAMADVVVDGKTLIHDAPVTYLLFLEKQVTHLRTILNSLPVLDESEEWSLDTGSGLYKSDIVKTHRTKKNVRVIVKYPATAEHPAQTDLVQEDQLAGHWSMIKHSGALPKRQKVVLLNRVEKLLIAVKEAREKANMADEITPAEASIGGSLFGYLLADQSIKATV